MNIKRNCLLGLGGALTLGLSAQASAIPVGGLDLAPGPIFKVASIYENVVTGNGQTLSGYGEVSQINGAATGDFCIGGAGTCELSYQFGGFTSANFTASNVNFDGGWINFYVGTNATGTNDLNPFASANSAADVAAATNGTLWLTLSGHPNNPASLSFNPLGVTSVLFANGGAFGTGNDNGTGSGAFDVDPTGAMNGNTAGVGAVANPFFNNNSIADTLGGFADEQLNTSFGNAVLPHPEECTATPPSGASCLAGSGDLRENLAVVPEPATIALLGIGLLGLGATARRRWNT